MDVIYAILASLLNIFSVIFAKLRFSSGTQLDSIFETTVRFFFTFIVTTIIALALGRLKWTNWQQITLSDWLWIILSGVFFAIASIFFYIALDLTEAAKVITIDRVVSIVGILILSYLFLKEEINTYKIIGTALMVVGLIVMNMK